MRARGVELRLEVRLEKANRGESFLPEGMRQVDVSVQRSFSVEVLDFP